eukprot:scaffold17924_cov20-Tisochrysis_lutea.AAC.2
MALPGCMKQTAHGVSSRANAEMQAAHLCLALRYVLCICTMLEPGPQVYTVHMHHACQPSFQ